MTDDIDGRALDDCTVSVLARVLETVLSHGTPASGFAQLVLTSAQSSAELKRGRPLTGEIAPL